MEWAVCAVRRGCEHAAAGRGRGHGQRERAGRPGHECGVVVAMEA